MKPGLFVYAKTALKYLASGFGEGARTPWWQIPGILITVIVLTTALCLIKALAQQDRFTRDPRTVGLASFMVSCMAVAWVVGLGRYAWGDTVLDSRYAASSVVALLGSYFVWELLGPPTFVPLGRMLLFTAAAGFLAANFQFGCRHGQALRGAERAFLRNLRAAAPIPRLVAHHSGITYYYHDRLEGFLRQLRDAGIAPYNRLPADSSFRCAHSARSPPRSMRSTGKETAAEFSGPMRISASTWTSRCSSAACGFDSRWSIPAACCLS